MIKQSARRIPDGLARAAFAKGGIFSGNDIVKFMSGT